MTHMLDVFAFFCLFFSYSPKKKFMVFEIKPEMSLHGIPPGKVGETGSKLSLIAQAGMRSKQSPQRFREHRGLMTVEYYGKEKKTQGNT